MMTKLVYNGITLDSLQVLGYTADVLTEGDGRTYTGTRSTLHVRGVYNPAVIAYSQTVRADPVAAQGTWAPVTEAAIRHALSQPRRTLIYSVGDTEVLRSPSYIDPVNPGSGSYATDVDNGPLPVVRSVKPNHGAKTFVVDFAVSTTTNECNKSVSTPSALLSHRWQEVHAIDQDSLKTRTIQGRAVLRADRLKQLNATADDYRAWLFHPVPVNFTRTGLKRRRRGDHVSRAP